MEQAAECGGGEINGQTKVIRKHGEMLLMDKCSPPTFTFLSTILSAFITDNTHAHISTHTHSVARTTTETVHADVNFAYVGCDRWMFG